MLNNSAIFDNHQLIIQNINCIYAKIWGQKVQATVDSGSIPV